MNTMIVLAVYIFVLYYFTIPGNLPFTLPSESASTKNKNMAHALVFTAVFLGTYKQVLRFTSSM